MEDTILILDVLMHGKGDVNTIIGCNCFAPVRLCHCEKKTQKHAKNCRCHGNHDTTTCAVTHFAFKADQGRLLKLCFGVRKVSAFGLLFPKCMSSVKLMIVGTPCIVTWKMRMIIMPWWRGMESWIFHRVLGLGTSAARDHSDFSKPKFQKSCVRNLKFEIRNLKFEIRIIIRQRAVRTISAVTVLCTVNCQQYMHF